MGGNDSVFIYSRPGGYVPAFRRRDNQHGCGLATIALRQLLAEGLIAKVIEVAPVSPEIDLRIVFEGTIRVCTREQNHKSQRNRGLAEMTRNGFNSGR